MRVQGLGYAAEYFRLDGHDVVHAAVAHVDPEVRSMAPVWLPNIPPAPLCGLGHGASRRTLVPRTSGELCRPCNQHLRDLDEWVRLAERLLRAADEPAGQGDETQLLDGPGAVRRVHAMPF